ncbi:hypothetical protein C7999DRAFT_41061 [Corynascus novoguineensis]|uniref:Uncharacterized protein n=1 Tax=Corynascus novoguineensis TaxID=1126955 RepID=A0AAN7CSQ5_9PEZI|nr:hypothetical protein C7999DRAFT_41061 [Corynascus novoguineensis]
MCTEYHTSVCPACGKDYLVYVEFCKAFHPPLESCPQGTAIARIAMEQGGCPSRICPNSPGGGCALM